MVNERRKRIPRPLLWGLWALAGAVLIGVLVFVIVVAPSLLIRPPKTGLSAANLLKARNDARTTLVQALAGLAVAGGLAVTYRTYQQNRIEQDRTYQQHQQEQDRTYERELYVKAIEQLGHEKAPVRLGALYSLERLAEDKPERRPIIVDVICSYLRMPFSPTAPAINPESEATEAPEVPAAETKRRTEGTDNTWQQERQVRLTAQHILTEHLRDDRARDKRSTDPPDPRFWPNIRLNLVGATLIDWNLQNGVIADADFRGATFTGSAVFDRAAFTGSSDFREATFVGVAVFAGATFIRTPFFEEATFTGDAWFNWATFTQSAGFERATFNGNALFAETTFTNGAGFGEATFTGDAVFGGATFTGEAAFGGATFTGEAAFGGATFGRAFFREATFTGDADFRGATFTGNALFGEATFTGNALFGGATFSPGESNLTFERSRVVAPGAEHIWPTGWCLGPDGSGGYTVVRANNVGRS